MSNIKYWQSLEELQESPEFKEKAAKEFQEELPVFDYAEDTTKVSSTGRRDFLKMLGFSVSAAAIATSCKIPVKNAVPYVFDLGKGTIPEVLPGIADYFASTYYDGSDYVNILVKTRENRPIKIEGNTAAPFTKGGTSARSQASVLSLYDTQRLTAPQKKGSKTNWETLDKEVSSKLAEIAAAGGKIVLISNTIPSLVTKKAIEQFKSKYPTAVHVAYDPVSLYAMRKANSISLGSSIIPSYHFDKADVVVGVNCDFLGAWLAPVENTKAYSSKRVPTKENPTMSRHYQFQSQQTITGFSADYKQPINPSEERAVLQALYNKVASLSGAGSLASVNVGAAQKMVEKAATDLVAAKGKSLVVCGSNDVQSQLITNAINTVLGNYGATINTALPQNLKQGDDEALAALAKDLGSVQALIFLEANPVFDSAFAAEFKAKLPSVKLSVSTADRVDETASLVQYVAPASHYLESWDILEVKSGFYSFVQPTINQLFDTRQSSESLVKWAGGTGKAYDLTAAAGSTISTGIAGLLGNTSWETALQQGFVLSNTAVGGSANLGSTLAAIQPATAAKAKGLELVVFESIAMGDGRFANNPFLQELPDPVTKMTWDNSIAISYAYAEKIGFPIMDSAKEVPLAKVTVGKNSIVLPVIISYGQAADTLAIALGYGRKAAGKAAEDSGMDAYPFVNIKDGVVNYSFEGAQFELTGETRNVGITQTYHTLMEDNNLPGRPKRYRTNVVKETNLKSYQANEHAGNEDREKIKHHLVTLYKGYDSPGHHWSMAVDLNACIGCSACVISCNVENNIPVIGRTEMYKSRSMHWMRMDRYYNGDPNNPDVTFQPMMCQHCDNAPCENVCPVNATNHSSEGLNQMAYNRCIGTKYCANNCPFKVRKFNWYDYQGNDSFGKWTDHTAATYMFEDLTRMVLNPDVTVRSRGVIEKCSFCVQKIQAGKLNAKSEGRPLKDGEVKTACQTACPTNAIKFGDRNDKESEIHQIFFENARNYHIYEEQHFLPNVGYQVKIRNKDEDPQLEFIHKQGKA